MLASRGSRTWVGVRSVTDKEYNRLRSKLWNDTHPDYRRLRARQWRKEHPEKAREIRQRYYWGHREEILAKRRAKRQEAKMQCTP